VVELVAVLEYRTTESSMWQRILCGYTLLALSLALIQPGK